MVLLQKKISGILKLRKFSEGPLTSQLIPHQISFIKEV